MKERLEPLRCVSIVRLGIPRVLCRVSAAARYHGKRGSERPCDRVIKLSLYNEAGEKENNRFPTVTRRNRSLIATEKGLHPRRLIGALLKRI